MGGVLKEDELTIIYAKNFLHFECKFECFRVFKSSEFNIGGQQGSFLEFIGRSFYLHNPKPVENGHSILTICDKNNSCIENITKSMGRYKTENEKIDLLGVYDGESLKKEKFPITICCIILSSAFPITIYPFYSIFRSLSNTPSVYNNLSDLSSDFKKLLEQSVDTDITLKTNGDIIKAHKLILRARSPVFHKMFQYDSSESSNNSVAIPDIGQATMMRLVKYLYSGTTEEYNCEETIELYYAADKYEVLPLRDDCKLKLLNKLDINNACSLYTLASRHEDEDLKKGVLQFVSSNFVSVLNSAQYLELNKEDMAMLSRYGANGMEK